MALVVIIVVVLAALLVIASGAWVAVGLIAALAAPKPKTPAKLRAGGEADGRPVESDRVS